MSTSPEGTVRPSTPLASGGPKLSVVVPVYNEEENLADLGKEIREALVSIDYEVILVDDGSTDRSFAEIETLGRLDPRFKAVRLGTNFGQTAAMAAGIDHAAGQVLAFLDSDLQNDPRDIPGMLVKLDEGEGWDVVSGWRKRRQDKWFTRRLPSQIANAIISRTTGVTLHDYGCTLKIYRADFIKNLRLYGEMHRFIPALAGFLGARIVEVPVNHRPRTRGVSKYGLIRIFKVVLDLHTVKFMHQYLTKPNYLFGGGGALMLAAGAFLGGVTLYKKYWLGVFVKDQPLFQISIFFSLIGLQLLLLGLLAEILIRIYYELRGKRNYFVRRTVNFK
ncbi:MAG: glycosyltransferase [Elusimicrobia bacterium CG_4_9_14_3_um_filter_62_55]|nr:MAG: glycosyltransferase [Elusimicrobia bacterium CG22_combo_CG10-13_8_21_14_all_63_91]PJA18047.1 MAG: glycosyltransferase [Elusimicrobia bacterium CG_4_10_14_0_2_um_filter_63_34]PJB23903.1 MAG: glycosyltransferase [Elusimicrobia bacterium CG_4_9_14_3_um_filter_62_55]